jgi:RNA polymerase sigma factor (sigma-70 family)
VNPKMDAIKLYEPMMKSIIKKYLEYAGKVGLDYDDLFQEASMAVIRAENTYKDNKGMKLETWLYNNIDWRIQRVLEGNKKYENIISVNSTIESSEGSTIELMDLIADDLDLQEEIEDKLMIQTYKREIEKYLDANKSNICILRWFEDMNYDYIEKVTNTTGISNHIRESRMTLIRKSMLFRNEYKRIHHIDDYSNTERLALM